VAVSGANLEDHRGGGIPIGQRAFRGNGMEKKQVSCLECGGTMRTRREIVPFDKPIGLPGVRLETLVARCPKCAAYEVIIPNLEGLHQAIARTIVQKSSRLSGAEIRFLRKMLGWSGADFAEHMGTSAETVSRWETGAAPMGAQADRLLRLMVMTRDPVAGYRKLDLLKSVARAKPTVVRLLARAGVKGAWNIRQAA
jgi:putative zinc finger/helix-turn-helix YgiT family protein